MHVAPRRRRGGQLRGLLFAALPHDRSVRVVDRSICVTLDFVPLRYYDASADRGIITALAPTVSRIGFFWHVAIPCRTWEIIDKKR
jgi:hypothetical protein